eukprot:CAMPEP_0172695104 /NCGR_PEP_ID=MMETSP1074-20121228/27132_1 /TAXON_ID=2916 /ORGANISM="Ceratium fusus, Strain PA161109" /LENGTH=592 /DNA_ID=CAMNT_0013515687 /DNA_START=52 /DNA_END=1827 /DNA_ORIENTATION=+
MHMSRPDQPGHSGQPPRAAEPVQEVEGHNLPAMEPQATPDLATWSPPTYKGTSEDGGDRQQPRLNLDEARERLREALRQQDPKALREALELAAEAGVERKAPTPAEPQTTWRAAATLGGEVASLADRVAFLRGGEGMPSKALTGGQSCSSSSDDSPPPVSEDTVPPPPDAVFARPPRRARRSLQSMQCCGHRCNHTHAPQEEESREDVSGASGDNEAETNVPPPSPEQLHRRPPLQRRPSSEKLSQSCMATPAFKAGSMPAEDGSSHTSLSTSADDGEAQGAVLREDVNELKVEVREAKMALGILRLDFDERDSTLAEITKLQHQLQKHLEKALAEVTARVDRLEAPASVAQSEAVMPTSTEMTAAPGMQHDGASGAIAVPDCSNTRHSGIEELVSLEVGRQVDALREKLSAEMAERVAASEAALAGAEAAIASGIERLRDTIRDQAVSSQSTQPPGSVQQQQQHEPHQQRETQQRESQQQQPQHPPATPQASGCTPRGAGPLHSMQSPGVAPWSFAAAPPGPSTLQHDRQLPMVSSTPPRAVSPAPPQPPSPTSARAISPAAPPLRMRSSPVDTSVQPRSSVHHERRALEG